jgi:serine phosphatase RsbU (regulator of sigma subunit)
LLGGDFFDLVQRPDGSVHVVVGDVCGQGPDEAAIGVSLRAAWRALALTGGEPEAILRTLAHLFEHERHLPALFATLCTLAIKPAERTASMIRAGHPQPVLIAGGDVSALSGAAADTSLGIGNGRWHAERLRLPDGWAILLYTDGIIEGRVDGGPERLGEGGLQRLLAGLIERLPRWREQPEELLDALIAETQRLNGGALSDDVAMLFLGTPADAGRP